MVLFLNQPRFQVSESLNTSSFITEYSIVLIKHTGFFLSGHLEDCDGHQVVLSRACGGSIARFEGSSGAVASAL